MGARSPQGPGTKSTMDASTSESKTPTNGKETSDIDKWKSEVDQEQMDKWQTNIDPKSQKKHQNGTHEPKIGPKKAEHGTTRGQKWSQEGPKRVQKRSQSASGTTKRTKTNLRLSWDPPKVGLA